MNFQRLTAITAILCALGAISQPAQAGTLYKDWNYAIDSFNDGVSGGQVGGGIFEFYGFAIKESNGKIIVALNSNLPLSGKSDPLATNGSISYGDIFFNFTDQNFKTASDNGDLFAIRFAEANDSGVATTGVYKNAIGKNVTLTNSGFSSLDQYNNYVQTAGGTPSMADLAANDPYFEQTGYGTVLNSIASGTKIGDINFLSAAALSEQGLDFGYFGATGSQTVGFSLDKSLLPNGNFIANFFAECANDGIAIQGELKSVPEPSSLAGLGALIGLILIRRKGRKIDLAS